MIKIARCLLCGNGNLKVLKTFKFFYPGGHVHENLLDIRYVRLWVLFEKILKDRNSIEFQMMLCQSCGFIFTNPRFTQEEVSIKYATINALGSVKKRYQVHPAYNLDVRANRIYSLITSLRRLKVKDKILDYGGSQGYNLSPFVLNRALCYILDYEKWDFPSGIEYLGEDLESLQPNDLFDVILCLHTLEHVIEPMPFLRGLSAHLSGNGLLYVEVPLGCFRECKHLTEPLTHVNFFSEESIYKGLRSIGLSVIHLSTAYQWVINGNMWCINVVARKSGQNVVTNYKTTRRQMGDFRYYCQTGISKVFRIVKDLSRAVSGARK